jgi:hypothetical protein
MKFKTYITVAAMVAVAMTACQEDMGSFDNIVYEPNAAKLTTVLMDGTVNEASGTVSASMAKPLDYDVNITFAADMDKLADYNELYGEEALPLPAENYEIPEPTATILSGAVSSAPVTVKITNLDQLDRNLVYVLPVSIVEAPIEVVASKQTSYFVVRGAALINVVANINENYCSLKDAGSATSLGSMSQVTVEALVKIDEFGKLISTVMGIEGNFLLRIGDAGVPDNQLQIATSNGNVTDAAWQFDTNKWIALAVTFDSSTGAVNVYFDGVKKGSTQTVGYRRAVNWNSGSFYIGKSYDDARYLDGCISEARVWNKILDEETLKDPSHPYTVDPESEGLVSYWKFNEGSGLLIHDYANGYDLICNSAPTWIPVELPK